MNDMTASYTVVERGEQTIYEVWLAPYVRRVSHKQLTHDEAAVLCERLNREVEA